MCGMIDIKTTYHSWSLKKRHLINSPWYATNLCTYLYQYLRDNRAKILPSADSSNQYHLRDNRYFFKKHSLNLIIEYAVSFVSREKDYSSLNWLIKLCSQSLLPHLNVMTLNHEACHLLSLVAKLLNCLLHVKEKLLGRGWISLLVEETPLLQSRLLKHLTLNFLVEVTPAWFDVVRNPCLVLIKSH